MIKSSEINLLDFLDNIGDSIMSLEIDSDLDLTNISPQLIKFPKNLIVSVKEGAKILTPFVELPIKDTVNNTYVQINFEGEFIANKRFQCFEGDALIEFKYQSVDHVHPTWWGLKPYSSGSKDSNVIALQKAVNSVCLNRRNSATTEVKLPNGDIYLNSPVVAINVNKDSHPFITGKRIDDTAYATVIKIIGTEPVKHEANWGNESNIIYTANWGSPFMIQGGRNFDFVNIRWEGKNSISSKDSIWQAKYDNWNLGAKSFYRPDFFDGVENAWISDNIYWNKWAPYACIITDPFRVAVADGKAGFSSSKLPETTLDLYYGENLLTHQNCWDGNIKSHHSHGFVSFFVNGLTGLQGDTFVFEDIMAQDQPFIINQAQNQTRDCRARNVMAYGQVFSAFDTIFHGKGGVPVEIEGFHSAGGLKYLVTGSNSGRTGAQKISNVYAENIYSIGKNLSGGANPIEGNGQSRFFSTIIDSTFKIYHGDTFVINGKKGYLKRPDDIQGYSIINSSICGYAGKEEELRNFHTYQDCSFINAVFSYYSNEFYPFDTAWKYKLSSNIKMDRKQPSLPWDKDSIMTFKEVNTGFKNGTGLSFSPNMMNLPKYYELEDTINMRQYDASKAIVEKDLGLIELTIEENKGLEKLDFIILKKKPSFSAIGMIVDINDNIITVAKLTEQEFSELDNNTNQLTKEVEFDRIYKVCKESSFTPFVAKPTDNPNEIEVVYQTSFTKWRITQAITYPKKNTTLKIAGASYRVDSRQGNIITLDKNLTTDISDGKWISPLYPSFETKNFRRQQAVHNLFSSGFYEKGKSYDYYEEDELDGYVLCTKTGDFYENDVNSEGWKYKANFIRYNSTGDPISYIYGSLSNSESSESGYIERNYTLNYSITIT